MLFRSRTLFVRALDWLEQARTRSTQDVRLGQMLAQTLAARGEFLRRLGQLRESLDDWNRAIALAPDADILALGLGRVITLSFSRDYRAALAEAAAADRAIVDQANERLISAQAHAVLSNTVRHDRSLTHDARAQGAATHVAAALEQIGEARRAPDYQDTRRLYHRLRDQDFNPLREQPVFQTLMMDLAFPAHPFAHHD